MVQIIQEADRSPVERRVYERDDSGGWAVAVIILLAVIIVGGYLWLRAYRAPSVTPQSAGANINVTVPSNPLPSGGSNSGSGGGATPGATPGTPSQ